MRTGTFAPDGQPTQEQPFRKGNLACSHEWLEDVASLDEVLARLDALRAADPAHCYLSTLDDLDQCSYTCGHASQDERLYLEVPEGFDWEDPVQLAAWERDSLLHRAGQLRNPELMQSWEQVCGTLCTIGPDVDALLAANRAPEQLLDDVLYLQRVPVAAQDLAIAGLPNGYFSADWDMFQNHAVIRHLGQAHGYVFFGMGASWLGFARAQPPDAAMARQLAAELRQLYGKGREEVLEHGGWAQLAALLAQRRTLLLGYTESFAETLDLGEGD